MTATTDFKDFVERQKRLKVADSAVDWAKERDEWLARLRELYDRISAYLAEYIASGAITISTTLVGLHEENIGAYTAESRTIVIGGQKIVLKPVGTLLIGSKGRVDVEGSAGRSRLVLMDKNVTNPAQMIRVSDSGPRTEIGRASSSIAARKKKDWAWKIATRPPVTQFIELNKESFLEMLLEVSNG